MLSLYLSLIETYDEGVRFEKLYNTYKEDMFKVAYDVVRNQYDAEDAVHNAFLSIARNFSVVDQLDSQKQKAYVCRSARNCAINIYSKKNNDNSFVVSNAHDLCFSDVEDDILEKICREENIQKIKACILELPETYRDVLHLYYVEEMKINKIAHLLGLKEDTVRKRLLRGKKALIESFNDLGTKNYEKED